MNPLKELRSESLCLLNESQEDYWRYARKGPHDFSVYTEKSSIYETPTKEKFKESTDVLVRWTDGLLYLATIIQVEDEYSRCAVKFEDGSQFWALYKDIYKGPLPDNEFACTVCDSSSSQPPDEIVICDKCSVGYHQLCHIPKIATSEMNPDIPWSCRKCVFVATAKKGGATKKGSNAQAMLLMKETIPYNIDALTWDASHRSNLQQTYCYCGGPGEWHSKMLQCLRCKQWFHEACLQCLDEPLLYGDRFYIFVCTVCNKGPEFLRRLPLRWPDIAHLVLFNLSIMHGKKFFEFETTIMPFLKENWSQFQIKGEECASRMLGDEKKKKLLEHLQNSKSRFTSSKEMKRKETVWGLRSRVPPPVPAITLPKSGVITNDVLDSFKATSRKTKTVVKSNSEPVKKPAPVKRPRKPSERESTEEFVPESAAPKPVTKVEKPIQPPSEEEKPKRALQQPKKEKRKLPHRLAKRPKPNGPKIRKVPRAPHNSVIDLTESDDTSSSHGTLNSIIPYPINFEGLNNPFLSNCPTWSYSETSTSNCPSETNSNNCPSRNPESNSNCPSRGSDTVSNSSGSSNCPSLRASETAPSRRNSETARSSETSRKYPSRRNSETVSSRSLRVCPPRNCTEASRNSESLRVLPPRNCSETSRNNSETSRNNSETSRNNSETSRNNSETASNCPSRSNSETTTESEETTDSSRIRNGLGIQLRVRPSRKYTAKGNTSTPESVVGHLLKDTSEMVFGNTRSPSSTDKPSSGQDALDLSSSVSSYFGMADRIENGEKFSVLAKRTAPGGKVQYLVEWDCLTAS